MTSTAIDQVRLKADQQPLKVKKWAHAHSVLHLGFELKIIACGNLYRPGYQIVATRADELDL